MIVLDTHAWVWWVSSPKRIPAKANGLIDAAIEEGEVLKISSISVWEVAMLVGRGRLQLTMDVETWISKSESLPQLEFVPVDNHVALGAVRLAAFPVRDPADRLIVSTALGLGATLITGDTRLHRYRRVRTAWR